MFSFQSPWIRFARYHLGEYHIMRKREQFQSPWIRFAHGAFKQVPLPSRFQSPWIRFALRNIHQDGDFLQEVSIPVDKVRARSTFSPRSLSCLVSIPVDKVRAEKDCSVAQKISELFQSPWIRFARIVGRPGLSEGVKRFNPRG